MPNLNVVTVGGHLGKDAVQRFLTGGMSVVGFSVATNRKVKGADVTDWHAVKAFGSVGADVLAKLVKGAGVVVTGRLTYERWTGEGGQEKERAVIVADAVGVWDRAGKAGGEPVAPGAQDDIPF